MFSASSADPGRSCGRRLRRDAQRNRDALLEAARVSFAQVGLEAPLDQIAKDAGLANGTLYRHFATRLDLVQALYTDKLHRLIDVAERAVAMREAWAGFVLFVETACELQADDQGFSDVISTRLPAAAELGAAQDRIAVLAVRIIRRAQEQGSLREDLTTQDLQFLVWAQSRINQATRPVAPRAWRRHLYLMFDAFRAERAHPLPEPPMTEEEAYRAMIGLNGTNTTA
jgi:AcrR family transcriptional regulator